MSRELHADRQRESDMQSGRLDGQSATVPGGLVSGSAGDSWWNGADERETRWIDGDVRVQAGLCADWGAGE